MTSKEFSGGLQQPRLCSLQFLMVRSGSRWDRILITHPCGAVVRFKRETLAFFCVLQMWLRAKNVTQWVPVAWSE